MNSPAQKQHRNSHPVALAVSFSVRVPKSFNPVHPIKRFGRTTVFFCKSKLNKLRLFSINKHRNGRRMAVAISFSLPVLKPLPPAQLIKGLIIAVPIVFFSVLLNNNYHFFPSHTGDANIAAEQATTVPPPTKLTAAKTVKVKPPPPAKVTVNLLKFKSVKGYQPSQVAVRIDQTFRGSHQLYVYAAHEKLDFSFDKVDLNRYPGPETLTARITKVKRPDEQPKNWKQTVIVGDDGVTIAKGPRGKPQHVTLSLSVGRPGYYLIDLATTEDVFISDITSRQPLLAFKSQVFFADGPANSKDPFIPVLLTTNSTSLAFSANHYTGYQDIAVNDVTYRLQYARNDQVLQGLNGTTKVEVPKGDAIFRGDGLLSVAPAELIPTAWSTKSVKVAKAAEGSTQNDLVENFR